MRKTAPAAPRTEPAAGRVGVANRQRRVAVDLPRVTRLLEAFARLAKLPDAAEVDCALLSMPRMRALNRDYRGIDRATDVLSFPFAGPDAGGGGSIAIAPAALIPEATRGDLSLPLAERLLHGALHLAGHDHPDDAFDGTAMGRLQARLLARVEPPLLARLARVAPAARKGGR